MKPRIAQVGRLFAVLFVIVGLRVAYLQLAVRGYWSTHRAEMIRWRTNTDVPTRRMVVDAAGEVLAETKLVTEIRCNPWQILDANVTATRLAEILGMPADSALPMLTTRYDARDRKITRAILFRDVPTGKVREVKRLASKASSRDALKGIVTDYVAERVYPQGADCAHVVGMIQSGKPADWKGVDGIEANCDAELAGTSVTRKGLVGPDNLYIPSTVTTTGTYREGRDVRLTLDLRVQRIVAEALQHCADKHTPVGVTAVVIEPTSGNVLAMVSLPTFDPATRRGVAWNTLHDEAPRCFTNKALDRIEVGSVMKPFSIAVAIDRAIIRDGDSFSCGGTTIIGGKPVRCAHGAHGPLDTAGVIIKSCNVSTALVGVRLRRDPLQSGMALFGLLETPQLHLPADKRGCFGLLQETDEKGRKHMVPILDMPDKEVTYGRVAFGQASMLSPLAICAGYGAFVNDGDFVPPRLVDGTIDPASKKFVQEPYQPRRRAVSRATARLMFRYMERVVSEGTGGNAAVPGYRVCGKTGTGQKVKRGVYAAHIGSFVGWLPASKPRAIIGVFVDEPMNGYYGGEVAAPYFREIGERLMWLWKVPTDAAGASTARAKNAGGARD